MLIIERGRRIILLSLAALGYLLLARVLLVEAPVGRGREPHQREPGLTE